MLAVHGRDLDVAAEEMDVAFLGSRGEGVPHQVRRQTRGQADGIPYGGTAGIRQKGAAGSTWCSTGAVPGLRLQAASLLFVVGRNRPVKP